MEKKELEYIYSKQLPVKKLIEWVNGSTKDAVLLDGLHSSSKAFAISSSITEGLHFVLLNNKEEAAYFANDLYSVVDKESVYFFPSTTNPGAKNFTAKDSSNQVQRTATIKALKMYSDGEYMQKRLIVVGYPQSVSELIITNKNLKSNILKISKGDNLSHDFIKETLIAYSFERRDFVSEPGQFALRGSLIDVFSYSENKPFRIDFFGDQVEKIKKFDINSQRSQEEVDDIELFPDIYEYQNEQEQIDIFNFIKREKIIWITDVEYFVNQITKLSNVESDKRKVLTGEEFEKLIKDTKTAFFAPIPKNFGSINKIEFHTVPQPTFNKNFDLLANDIKSRKVEGYQVYILSENQNQTERLKQIFSASENKNIDFTPLYYSIHEGFIDHFSKQCFYTDHEIFERYHRVKTERSVEKSERLTINDLNSFQIGDYIVHIDHGVGVFGGLVKTQNNGKQQEAIKLVYRDNDVLFVSIHGLHRISRYKSKDATSPKIYKLGTGTWQKLKTQTKSKVKDIAKELIILYSKRKSSDGYAFSQDSFLQNELEASFIYEDTPDQFKATKAIKEDMEQKYPMDRLICGDVGFGKTELAIRAAFKAVADNKQVAVLVPTTILALQHYNTFTRRLKDFPCNISYISRLRTAKEIKSICEDLEKGKVDIIIGTHRLLNKEIKFKDLGLLVIDEEQKFGVAAKERLRQLKLEVDTLTLSATPIPRTLQFSLLGARDLSIISTPPPNRLPIQTEIIDFNEDLIADALNFEIERGGQIFFVHNRVEDIRTVEEIIRRICPKAKTCIGHGQMEPTVLEKVILDFMVGDYDILISTTIIENGIDISNANTIIINQAQNFGLSDLHQLRGRVGRSNTKAFCYLIVPSLISVSDDARRRLKAIEAFSDLGSGFNIAMQDLDIRGAGNLLGGEQSGFVADMGFETYQRILNEAFSEMKEEIINSGNDKIKFAKEDNYVADCSIDTDLEILIPDDYVNIIAEKIRLYKELDAIVDEKDLSRFLEELSDRFGPVPEPVRQLAFIVRLRRLAIELGFERIILKNGIMLAYFVSNQLSNYYKSENFAKILAYLQNQAKRFRLKEQNEKLYITVNGIDSVEKAFKIFLEIKT